MKVVSFVQGLKETLYSDSTRPLRLIVALVEWLFVAYFYTRANTEQFVTMNRVIEADVWVFLFLVHSGFLLLGLTGRYNRWTLFGEGVMGMFLWWVAAITHWASEGIPGPTLACAIAMTIIFVNYPTHKKWRTTDE